MEATVVVEEEREVSPPVRLNAKQAQEYLGVGKSTFYEYRNEGAFRVVDGKPQNRKLKARYRSPKGKGHPFFYLEDLEEFEAFLALEPFDPDEA